MPQDDIGLPKYIAVEGPIGVGKTSLTKRLAETFNYGTLLENAEQNPFLENFYRNNGQGALSTQLFFLLQRAQQIQDLLQEDLSAPVRAADFLLEKDPLFAKLSLNQDEFALYQQVYQHLTVNAPVPDLVIYLQAPTKVLQRRIQHRGVPAERHIHDDYLSRLNESYASFFHYYAASPLLIVNAEEVDLINNEQDYQQLITYVRKMPSRRHYLNAQPISMP